MSKLLIPFMFEEKNRSRLTFSDSTKIRLNPATDRIELKSQGWNPVKKTQIYPADEVYWVKTWEVSPTAMKSWSAFFCDPIDSSLPSGTQISFKVNDGTHDLFWDGSTWSEADNDDWNTHSDVCSHIASFPVISQKISFVVGLSTTTPDATPWVNFLDLLMEAEIESFYSILAGSLVPKLRESIEVPIDFAIDAPGGMKISLLDTETPFEIKSVSSVFDHTNDSYHRINLLSSYDSDTKSIILSSEIERGDIAWISFVAQPAVMITYGNQDYIELEKIPCMVINAIKINELFNEGSQVVKNVNTHFANVIKNPVRLSITFDILLIAEKTRTLLAMIGEIVKFSANNKVLNWRDVDQDISLMNTGISLSSSVNVNDQHEATVSFLLKNAYLWIEQESITPLVQNINLNLRKKYI